MNVRAARTYVFVSALVALFGAVYEHYSFGVYSYWMIYAFAVPLAFGAVPALMLATTKRVSRLPAITRKLWHAGIAVWTVGSIYTGVLAIYGTDSSWSAVYAAAGCALLSVAAITAVFRKQE
ncbi:MAG: hypothetical protein J6Y67_02265 [Lachnospiraceae bacterium]|nr:hypothetical protein [Lachnospiraceae bacterium]